MNYSPWPGSSLGSVFALPKKEFLHFKRVAENKTKTKTGQWKKTFVAHKD